MEMFMDFINPNLFILIPVMNIIGTTLKSSSVVKNNRIPIYLGFISIFLCSINLFASISTFTLKTILTCLFSSITQGILIAAVSVYAHQVYKLYMRTRSENASNATDEHSINKQK